MEEEGKGWEEGIGGRGWRKGLEEGVEEGMEEGVGEGVGEELEEGVGEGGGRVMVTLLTSLSLVTSCL